MKTSIANRNLQIYAAKWSLNKAYKNRIYNKYNNKAFTKLEGTHILKLNLKTSIVNVFNKAYKNRMSRNQYKNRTH